MGFPLQRRQMWERVSFPLQDGRLPAPKVLLGAVGNQRRAMKAEGAMCIGAHVDMHLAGR